ncbi:hypothetical protein [Sorangium cellulosum]|uniref:hypothetical protein n=1 Tax=Sorangium cellulosum TaxID=56 RepID=UPI0018F882C4|nr:hypothetical protein [Sorangium cellulosum]
MLAGDDRDHEQADDLVFAEELPLEMMGKQAQTLVERSGHEANRRTTSPKAGAAIAAALRVLRSRARGFAAFKPRTKCERPMIHIGLAVLLSAA